MSPLQRYLDNPKDPKYGVLQSHLSWCRGEFGWPVLLAGVIRELAIHQGEPGTISYMAVQDLISVLCIKGGLSAETMKGLLDLARTAGEEEVTL